MSSFLPQNIIALPTGDRSAATARCGQKLPVPLNRPASDASRCLEETLGRRSRPVGPPGGDDGDTDDLRKALQRYYNALSVHHGDAMIELERKFDTDLRTLSGKYERSLEDLTPTDRELCMIFQRCLERFEQDIEYHARGGFEVMGHRLTGRLAGPYSVTNVVEAALQWWQNPRDRGLIKGVREAVDVVIMRRARGSKCRMERNRSKVEEMKQHLTNMSGEVKWDSCLRKMGFETNDVNMALLYVAAAEQGWRNEAGEEFNEFAADLGADQNSERCVIFPLPLPASVKEELLPVVCIKSLNEEVYGLLTGDRWFALHSSDVVFGAVVAVRYVEVEEQPETWGVIERRHGLETCTLTSKDCGWLSQLLRENPVDEVTVLYQNLIRHAQRGHLPEGRDVGESVIRCRDVLETKKILTASGTTRLFTARTLSSMFSLTGSRRSFTRALAEMVLGTITASTSIRCDGKRVKIEESIGKWHIKVTGPNKSAKDLETLLAAIMRLMGKRNVSCDVEGADLTEQADQTAVFGSTKGRIGLLYHDLWYARYEIPARIESPDE